MTDYFSSNLLDVFNRRKLQVVAKLSEYHLIFEQSLKRPELGLLGAFHGLNVGDNSLAKSVFIYAKDFYANIGVQNIYNFSKYPATSMAICAGGATGVQSNLVNLKNRYQLTPEKVALIGIDFSSDIDKFPESVLDFLSRICYLSCRSKSQANRVRSLLKRDVLFHFDNAFSYPGFRYLESYKYSTINHYKDSKILGFNSLNFFMIWVKSKGFMPGHYLAEWYKQQNSNVANYIESLGLAYINFFNDILDVYSSRKYKIIHIPFTVDDDLFARTFFKNKNIKFLKYNPNPDESIKYLSQCDLFISTRYHSLVFAIKLGIPCIPFCYAIKCTDLLQDLGFKTENAIDRMELIQTYNEALEKVVYPKPFLLDSNDIELISEETLNQILVGIKSLSI